MSEVDDPIYDAVRSYYRRAAADGRDGYRGDPRWGVALYDAATVGDAPEPATNLSMGCGNRFALADLAPGEVVLDLGSGGGLDVILSARCVAPEGIAYGVDFLDEMLDVARSNAEAAGVTNVEFLARAGLEDVSIEYTHRTGPGLHTAAVRATRP